MPRDDNINNDDDGDAGGEGQSGTKDANLSEIFAGGNSTENGDADGPQPAEILPSDLGGDEDDLGVEVDLTDPVDVDDISTPRPVTRTIAAISLTHDRDVNAVRWDYMPDRPDECECITEDADADDEDALDPVCTCDSNDDGIPYWKTTASRRRVADAVDKVEPAANADNDDLTETTVYGVVVQEFEDTDQFGGLAELQVRITDETGVADVELHPDMTPLEDYDVGDEILVTDVERTLHGTDDEEDAESNAAFRVTADSALLHVAESDIPVGERLMEQTALTRTPSKFDSMENKTAACNWVADVIVDEWHVETPRADDADMYVYVDDEDSERYGTFAGEGEKRIKEIIDQYLPPASCNRRNKNEIVAAVKDRTYVSSDAFHGGAPDNDARKWSVAVQNGVIDLRTGELYEHDPAWRCTAKLPIEYDSSKDEPGDAWDRFLDDVTKEQADRETLLYFIAHALTRHYPNEAIFALIGPGANGKSVWYTAVKALFGDAAGAIDIGIMTDPDYPFGAGAVRGRHLVVDDDATDVKANDLSMLKALSGGAESQIHEKKEKVNGAEYDNYATIGFLSNDPMILGDKSNGAKRRMYPVIMPHRFTNDPSDDHKDARPKDELLADLTNEEELQRLLAVAVQYAQRMKRDGEMEVGRSEDERWELYENYADSIREFWADLMKQETGARVPRSVVYEIYVQWAEENGIDPVPAGGRNGFWQLSDQCPAVSYKRDGVYTDGDRAVEHVMLTSDALDHAPQWIQDEWRDDVSEEESTLANRLDRVTPIADLNKGYCTTQGTVIGRETLGAEDGPEAVRLTIEDSTRAIDVYEWLGDSGEDTKLDGVYAGDTVKLERATLTAHKGEPQLKVKNVTEVTVAEAGPLKNEDDRHVEDGEDAGESDGEDMPQTERVTTVKNVVGSMQNRTDLISAPVEDVLNACEDRGIDREKAEHEVEKLKEKGELYAPKSDRVAVTGSD